MIQKAILACTLALTTVAAWGEGSTLDFGRANPSAEVIQGQSFPRTRMLKYRGTAPEQQSRIDAILALLGHDKPIESIILSGVKLLLMGESVPFYTSIATGLAERDLDGKIKQALATNGGKGLDESAARNTAIQLLKDDLSRRLSNGEIEDHFWDYKSPNYELFPQDMVFSTIHVESASIYAKDIMVIDEGPRPRMLDLNFWNLKHNGAWLYISHPWLDRGEFVAPFAIDSDMLVGRLEYLNKVSDYTTFRPLPHELDFAFYKIKEKNDEFVVVVDGFVSPTLRAEVVTREKEGLRYSASQFDPMAELPLQPRPYGPVNVIAIIKACPVSDSCKVNSPYLSGAQRSLRSLDDRLISQLKNARFSNLRPKIFYANGTLAKADFATDAFIPTLPNAADTMAERLNEESSSFKYSGTAPAPVMKGNTLHWDFAGRKLRPQEVLYLPLPESLKGKVPKNVELLQYQDNTDNSTPLVRRYDASPAYTSIQFYSLALGLSDRWRCYGGDFRYNPPGSAVYADIAANAAAAKPTKLTGWDQTKGYGGGVKEAVAPETGAIRLLGLGVDSATLVGLDIEFK